MDIIVATHVTKLLTKNFSLSAYGVRGQYIWPFKLYQFLMKEINKFATKARKQENLVFKLG